MWGLREVKKRTRLQRPDFDGSREVSYGQIGAGTARLLGVQADAWRNERHSNTSTGGVLSTGI